VPRVQRSACKSPVVLLVFRRPDVTARVFEAVRAARPPKLLVVADGPRSEAERELCERTRAVTEQVDWDCEVHRDYAEKNLGLRRRVTSGLDWAFRTVEEAIILEDDCLPHPSFFRFCDELLARYRDDPRVWMIAGEGFQGDGEGARGDASYYFSRYTMIWGWATWRRAWARYDADLAAWPAFRDSGALLRTFGDPIVARFWTEIFERLRVENRPDSWAYRWICSALANGGLAATPRLNLVSNIGFGADATNTVRDNERRLANLPTFDLGELRHPAEVAWDAAADRVLFDNAYDGPALRRNAIKERTLHRRLKRRWDDFRRRVGLKR
jgi:hypothetical protein